MARNLQRGLRFEPPMVLADVLEKRFGTVSDRARELALELLVPAIESGDRGAVDIALDQIEARLEAESDDSEIEAAAADAAERASSMHRKAFFAALGAAVGMKVLGTDDAPELAAGDDDDGGLIVQAAQLARGRRKGTLVAKLSAEPRLIAEQFARRNASLIKTLRAEVVPALRDEVVRAVEFGIDHQEAAARLADKWARQGVPIARGNMQPRIKTIARDQIAKLNGELTKARQQAAGIDRFRWRSQGDSRVRPLHRAIDGEVYSWEQGHPTEGLPGQPVLCRCFAEAVVDEESILNAPGLIHLGTASVEIAA